MKLIFIKTNFIGFHRWSKAPEKVKYLRSLHRHIFNIKAVVSVKHNEREVEFHLFKIEVDKAIKAKINSQNAGSCEAIAEIIFNALDEKYKNRYLSITTDEDNECGATMSRG